MTNKEVKITKGLVVKSDTNYTLEVLLSNGGIAYIPREYTSDKPYIRDIEVVKLVGKEVEGIYKEVGGKPILDIRELQRHYKENILDKEIVYGQVIQVKVLSVAPFGVFVDIGYGVIALLPYAYVSESKAFNLSDIFKEGKELYVIYKGQTEEDKYVVSHKELLGTWADNVSKFNEGDIVIGLVKDITDYGVFIEISPNLTGIADKPEKFTKIGDSLVVRVKKNYPEKYKLKLHIMGKSYKKYRIRYDYKVTEGIIKDWSYTKRGN